MLGCKALDHPYRSSRRRESARGPDPLYGRCLWRLNADDDVSEIFKNGRASISLGYIAASTKPLTRCSAVRHVYDNERVRANTATFVERLRQAVDQWERRKWLLFQSLYSTPSENRCDRFCQRPYC
ncbi:anaerobic ribonucleoside-triphosphate reductase [Escherichia coli]